MSLALTLLAGAAVGAGAGALAGLVPGLHPNTLAVLALGALPLLQGDAALGAAAGLVAMGLAHQFTSLVPGAFLGAPSPDDALRALPAHAMLREGRAHEAVQLAAQGAAVGAVVAMALVLPLRLLLGPGGEGYRWLEPAVPAVLACIAAVLLLNEPAAIPWRRALHAQPFLALDQATLEGPLVERRGDLLRLPRGWVHDPAGLFEGLPLGASIAARGRWVRVEGPGSRALGIGSAALTFALAGALGMVVVGMATPSPLGLPASPMFPLLTGLFGAPPLLLALRSPPLPPQEERMAAEEGVLRGSAAGAACGALVGLLPGMSSGAASVLALLGTGERDRGRALATLSAAGAGAAVITAAAFVLVGRARSGAMLAVQEVVAPVPWEGVVPPMLLAVLLLGCAAGIAVGYVATLVAGKAAAGAVDRVPYPALCAAVLTLLAALVGAATGPWGLAVVGAAAVVGLVPWRLGVRRSHLMGCTMLPLIASLAG